MVSCTTLWFKPSLSEQFLMFRVFIPFLKIHTVEVSSDGTTWTKVTATYTSDNGSTETPSFNDVTYGNGTFVAVNPNGIILTSTDVTSSWHPRTSGTTNDLNGVTYTE